MTHGFEVFFPPRPGLNSTSPHLRMNNISPFLTMSGHASAMDDDKGLEGVGCW